MLNETSAKSVPSPIQPDGRFIHPVTQPDGHFIHPVIRLFTNERKALGL
jgi:hypothetical protein